MSIDNMHTRCFCDKCHGTLVTLQTKLNHQRKQLKIETTSDYLQRKREEVFAAHHIAGPSSLVAPTPLHPPPGLSALSTSVPGLHSTLDEPVSLAQVSNSVSDLDSSTSIIYDTTPDSFLGVVDINPEDTYDLHEVEGVHQDDVAFPDEDTLLDNTDLQDEGNPAIYLGCNRPY